MIVNQTSLNNEEKNVSYILNIKYTLQILESLFVFEKRRPRIYSRVKVIMYVFFSEMANAYSSSNKYDISFIINYRRNFTWFRHYLWYEKCAIFVIINWYTTYIYIFKNYFGH